MQTQTPKKPRASKETLPVRSAKSDGFTDVEDWLHYLSKGSTLEAVGTAILEGLFIKCIASPVVQHRTERATRLIAAAAQNLLDAAKAILEDVPQAVRDNLHSPTAFIGLLDDADAEEILVKVAHDKYVLLSADFDDCFTGKRPNMQELANRAFEYFINERRGYYRILDERSLGS